MTLFPSLQAVAAFFLWTGVFPHQGAMATSDWPPDESCPPFVEPSRFRVEFSAGGGATVMGWPSKGGIYMLESCTGVELDFLGLGRFHNMERPPKSADADAKSDEEEHCNKSMWSLSCRHRDVLTLCIIVRQLGAEWWPNETTYILKAMRGTDWDTPFIQVGWPASGGVWVLKSTVGEAQNRGAGRIHNARNMEERCQIIEEDGGVFYADPKDCPHLDLP